MDKTEWNADKVVSHVDVYFDWLDRFRILFGRTARVVVRIETENVVGRTIGESAVSVDRIFPRKNGPTMAVAKEKI